MHRALPGLVLVALSIVAAPEAAAYTFETLTVDGCHEAISWEALDLARADGLAKPIAPRSDDVVWLSDLEFAVPSRYDYDVAAATLAIGVRDNDLRGRSGFDADELAHVHGDPEQQAWHCLRARGHDEPGGDEPALAACRAYILERFDRALEGLGPGGEVDPSRRVPLAVHLAIRGTVDDLALPTFYVRMGQALHALQDAYSHSFRTADGERITAVVNFLDVIDNEHEEGRDGPPHLSALDACTNLDVLRARRRDLAVAASHALLRAALAHDGADRREAAAAVVDATLAFEPGCTAENAWCNASENAYRDAGCLCAAAAPAPGGAWWLVFLGAGLGLVRRARGRAGRGMARHFTAIAFAGLVIAAPRDGAAQSPDAEPVSDEAQPVESAEPDVDVWPGERRTGFGAHLAVGGSVDNTAVAGIAGLRYGISDAWLIGLDAEYNPWISIAGKRVFRGAFNGYGVVAYRFAVSPVLALRTTGRVGVSVLLDDLVGVAAGSVGPFFAISPLGISYEIEPNIYFVLDPVDIAIPIPQVVGVPYSYRQYRLLVGFQLGS